MTFWQFVVSVLLAMVVYVIGFRRGMNAWAAAMLAFMLYEPAKFNQELDKRGLRSKE